MASEPPLRYNETIKFPAENPMSKDAKVTLTIEQDRDPQNPRDDDNLGKLSCWHRKYSLGDEQPRTNPRDFEAALPKGTLILPVYMYDHGGITIATTPFSCQFDSGQIGICWLTPERLIEEYGEDNEANRKTAEACMKAEISQYDSYLKGESYGFIIKDEKGEVVESCWGFDGGDVTGNGLSDNIPLEHLHLLPDAASEANLSCDPKLFSEMLERRRAAEEQFALSKDTPAAATPSKSGLRL